MTILASWPLKTNGESSSDTDVKLTEATPQTLACIGVYCSALNPENTRRNHLFPRLSGVFPLPLEVAEMNLLCKRSLNCLLEMAGGCRGKTC